MATPLPRPPRPTNPNRSNPLAQNVNNNQVGVPAIAEVPIEEKKSFEQWLNQLYDISDVTDTLLKELNDMFQYKGFNRDDVLKQIHVVAGNNKRIAIELIVVTALRGPQGASKIKLSNGKTPLEMKIPASGQQGTKVLSLNKIQAATADLAAYFLKRMNAPKRMNIDLPGWLQFPSAGSIKLPSNYRVQHMEFAKRFSVMIGGEFQETIYMQMENNAYLDERLHLFS